MENKPVGLLWDSVSNNTGDKAIGLVLRAFCEKQRIEYRVVDPFSFTPDDFSTLIIGGGELIRGLGDPFYDCYRVPGRQILNGIGMHQADHLEYLRDYALVTVRTQAERAEMAGIVPSVKVRPCCSLLMGDFYPRTPSTTPSPKTSIGVHIHYGTLDHIPDIFLVLREINRRSHLRFIPFTFYNNDIELMREMAARLPDASVCPLTDPVDIFHEISTLRGMISSSLHASIFSYVQNIPFIAFPYSRKVEAFLSERGMSTCSFQTADELFAGYENIISIPSDYHELIRADKQSVAEHLEEILAVIRQQPGELPVIVTQVPWQGEQNILRQYHKLLMDWHAHTGRLKTEIFSLKHTVTEQERFIRRITQSGPWRMAKAIRNGMQTIQHSRFGRWLARTWQGIRSWLTRSRA